MDEHDRQRIAGRKWAEDSILFAMEEGKDFLEGYRRAHKTVFAGDLVPDNEMTDQEAAAFEKQTIGFGVYADQQYAEVPADYLTWLVDQGRELRRYVRSERFKERQDG